MTDATTVRNCGEVAELQADPRDLIAARTAAATLSELISALAALKVADSLRFLAEEE